MSDTQRPTELWVIDYDYRNNRKICTAYKVVDETSRSWVVGDWRRTSNVPRKIGPGAPQKFRNRIESNFTCDDTAYWSREDAEVAIREQERQAIENRWRAAAIDKIRSAINYSTIDCEQAAAIAAILKVELPELDYGEWA